MKELSTEGTSQDGKVNRTGLVTIQEYRRYFEKDGMDVKIC